MKWLLMIPSVWLLGMAASSQAAEPVTPGASPEARALLNYLHAINGEEDAIRADVGALGDG